MKYKVIFDGFETEEQAKAFASWYEGSGEQDSGNWLEEHSNLRAAHVNMQKYQEQDWFKADANNIITVPLNLFYNE